MYYTVNVLSISIYEPRHDKTNKMAVRPAKTQISLGIRPDWSESSLSAWRKLGSLATHWADSEDTDQTGRMPRLIWVFAGRTDTLLVLSCRGSYIVGCQPQAFFSCGYLMIQNCTTFPVAEVCGSDGVTYKNRLVEGYTSNNYTSSKWAATWSNQQTDLAAQRRLRSA